jgi:hypothetical protein
LFYDRDNLLLSLYKGEQLSIRVYLTPDTKRDWPSVEKIEGAFAVRLE